MPELGTVRLHQTRTGQDAACGAPLNGTVRAATSALFIQGPPALATGFGTLDYTDGDAGTPLTMSADGWSRIARALTPSQANFNPPNGPWSGFAFWREGKLRAKAAGDIYLFKFSFRVVSSQRGGALRFAVRPDDNPAFDFGPEPIMLSADAGEEETGSVTFFSQARSRFVSAGASIYVLSSTGGSLLEFSPEIAPLGYHP